MVFEPARIDYHEAELTLTGDFLPPESRRMGFSEFSYVVDVWEH